jgi:flagellar M-ring protein FliF
MNTTLAAVLGPDHFKAGVTAEVDFTKGEQSEETWDPTKSVMVSQQRTEETNGGTLPSGIPGTPSNLPRPPARPGSREGGIVRRTENVTYQSSRLVRRTTLPEGVIKRLNVSAVIDQSVRWEGSGAKAKRVLEPPSDETLKKVRDLIAAAVGFNEQRGDQIVVQSLPFESTLRNAVPPEDPQTPKNVPQSNLIGLEKWLAEKNIKVSLPLLFTAAGVLTLLLIGAVVLFLRRKKKSKLMLAKPELSKQQELAEPGDASARSKLPALTQPAQPPVKGDKTFAQFEAREEALRHEAEREVLNALKLPELTTKKAEVLIRHITEHAKRDAVGSANLIRSWLMEKEQ